MSFDFKYEVLLWNACAWDTDWSVKLKAQNSEVVTLSLVCARSACWNRGGIPGIFPGPAEAHSAGGMLCGMHHPQGNLQLEKQTEDTVLNDI